MGRRKERKTDKCYFHKLLMFCFEWIIGCGNFTVSLSDWGIYQCQCRFAYHKELRSENVYEMQASIPHQNHLIIHIKVEY